MILLKNHNTAKTFQKSKFLPQIQGQQVQDGFLFIEMMVALTLLATFGSSLFVVQTNVLQKLFKTHTTITKMFELDKQLLQFTQDMQFALSQKKTIDSIKLHHENKSPAYVVDINMKNIAQTSKLFKNFGKDIALVQATIKEDNRSDSWWHFAYIKTADTKDDTQKSSAKKTTP